MIFITILEFGINRNSKVYCKCTVTCKMKFKMFIALTNWQLSSIMVGFSAYLLYDYYTRNKSIPIEGYFEPEFKKVAELFREEIWSGASQGASLAVYHRGKRVVDLWGGYSDHEFKIPWRNYSLTCVASVSKAMAAISLALLVQRGQLNYDNLVTEYWPEFGQNSKDNITVDMLLSHQAGIVTLEPKIPFSLLKDWKLNTGKLDAILVKQKPAWPPGTRFGYASLTYGLYVDALIRHVDKEGRTAGQFFHDEVAVPFGIDFYIGLPRELFYRKTRSEANREKFSWYFVVLSSWRYIKIATATITNSWFRQSVDILTQNIRDISDNDPEVAAVPWLSGHGYGTANAVAKLFSYLTTGDSTFLNNDIVDSLCEPVVSGVDSLLNIDATYGRGLWIMKNILGEDVVGHTGYGGQLAFADRKRHMSMAYLTNDFTVYVLGNNPKVSALERAVYECMDAIEAL